MSIVDGNIVWRRNCSWEHSQKEFSNHFVANMTWIDAGTHSKDLTCERRESTVDLASAVGLECPPYPKNPKYWAVGFIRHPNQIAWYLLMYEGRANNDIDITQPPSTHTPDFLVALAQMITMPHHMDEKLISTI